MVRSMIPRGTIHSQRVQVCKSIHPPPRKKTTFLPNALSLDIAYSARILSSHTLTLIRPYSSNIFSVALKCGQVWVVTKRRESNSSIDIYLAAFHPLRPRRILRRVGLYPRLYRDESIEVYPLSNRHMEERCRVVNDVTASKIPPNNPVLVSNATNEP